LAKLVKSYNNTYHRTIKTSPASVNKSNEAEIWSRVYGHDKNEGASEKSLLDFKFNVGDLVRISKAKGVFSKGYTANWTRELFKIHERLPRDPPVYKLIDMHDTKPEVIEGIFYEANLQKVVQKDNIYYIEDVIKERKTRGKEEAFVKWLGYPVRFNSWIPVTAFTKTFDDPFVLQDENNTSTSSSSSSSSSVSSSTSINNQKRTEKSNKKQRVEFSV
jgi:hypothetical protein